MAKILIILTSAAKTPTGKPAGYYLPETAHPYYSFVQAGFHVDFASPEGSNPPVNQWSVENFKDNESVKFLYDPDVQKKLLECMKLTSVEPDQYEAVFYPGGHGPVIDLWKDETNIALASTFWEGRQLVTAVCHGPAALVRVNDSDGKSIFAGKNFTGFSNEEEELYGLPREDIGFWLEENIRALGGRYSSATKPMQPHVVVDGKLYTGQNPLSAKPLAEKIVEGLRAKQ